MGYLKGEIMLEVGDKVRVMSKERIAELSSIGVETLNLEDCYYPMFGKVGIIEEINFEFNYYLEDCDFLYPEEVLELV